MKYQGFALIILLAGGLSGCFGKDAVVTCDEVEAYQLAQEGRRIESPEDLDNLNELKEIPLPKASPRPPRPEGSPCLDLPPSILGGGSQ